MPADSPMTLRAAFDDFKADSWRVTLVDDASAASAVSAQIGAIEWTASASVLLPKVAELLDIPLPRIFVAFWEKAEEIARAVEESRKSPDDSIEATLVDCSTEATLEPYIEIRFKGAAPPKRISIVVSLPLTFRAVKLTIRRGAIVGIAAGECDMDGAIKLGTVTLAKFTKPRRITLAGWNVPFDPPPVS